ncbi:amidase [Roseibium sp. AS2]|uniref:amidase n=1 Tax=Roseibium sp. AS2 TaxID=3135781 RepID=UPI00317E46F7
MPVKSIAQLANDLREGAITCRELMAAAVDRYAATEPRLNAYRSWAGDRALAQADAVDTLLATGVDLGPLMGLPVSVKDLYGVPGLPVFGGTDTAFPPDWETAGPVVSALLAQLGIVTGKTQTVEFAFGGLGTNPHAGTPLNPWSGPHAPRAPGGSSSGAGISLVQGSALLALGTDTAGSVRIPASFNGQTALKITHGRWSLDGIIPLSPSLDTPGLLARTIEDLAVAFAALDPDGGRPVVAAETGLRLGVVRNVVWDGIDDSIAQNTSSALRALEGAGATLNDVELPCAAALLEVFRAGGLAAPELRAFLDRNFPERIERLDPAVMARVQAADEIGATEYLRRRAVLAESGQTARRVFDTVDFLVTPTVPVSAPVVADLADPETYRAANMLALRNTAIVNLLGWCAITLPTGLDANGIPSGLQIIAGPGQEERLLAVGLAVENILGQGPDLLGLPPL